MHLYLYHPLNATMITQKKRTNYQWAIPFRTANFVPSCPTTAEHYFELKTLD